MRGLSLFSTFLYILMLTILMACAGNTGSETKEEQKKEEVSADSWHMTDEPVDAQADAELEESFRLAAFEGDLEKVKMLLKQGVKCDAKDADGHTALMFAAYNGHSEIILALLEAGAETDQKDSLDRTALLYGATGPFPEAVKILLDHGANPNTVDSDEHFSALMHAAAEGNLEVVRVLLNFGADATLKDADGDDAATFATQNGHMQVVEYLKSVK